MRRALAFVVGLALCGAPSPAAAQGKPPPAAPADPASRLDAETQKLYAERRYADAVPLVEKALALREKSLPPGDLKIANSVRDLAELRLMLGQLDRAEPLYERAVAMVEAALGKEELGLASLLNNLGVIRLEKGDLPRALVLFQRALAIREKALPPAHPEIVSSLDRIGDVHRKAQAYDEALGFYRRAHAIREKALGPDHPVIAGSLQAVAAVEIEAGDYRGARERLARALAIREKAEGPDTVDVALVLNNMAELSLRLGRYVEAEPLYVRSLAIFEKQKGPDAPEVGTLAGNLGSLHVERGDYDRALPLLQRALAVHERALGKEHTDVAGDLGNLAEVHMMRGDLASAEPLLVRALAIRERAHGKEDGRVAVAVHNLASLYQEKGDLDRAEPLLVRALAIWEKARGPEDPDVSRAANNLASLYDDKGELDRAEALYRRALAIQEKVLGPAHPLVAISLFNLAATYERKDDLAKAREAYERANELAERHLAVMMTAGSEQQRLRAADQLTWLTQGTVSFHLARAKASADAATLAMTTVLRRKGRVLDAVAEGLGALRARLTPEARERFDALAAVRAQMAAATLRGGAGRAALDALEPKAQALEAALAAESAEFRASGHAVALADVQRALPDGAVLVEVVSYRPFDAKKRRLERWGAPHYAAYVLGRTGAPAAVDLGEAAPIDAAVESLRAALADPRSPRAKDLGRALGERVYRPIAPLLGGSRTVLVSPDGALNLVPWGAFVGDDGHYLIERASFTYLTSGRDLLRLGARAPSRGAPVVVAAPAFDAAPVKRGAEGATREADVAPESRGVLAKLKFPPLPGTEGEAAALRETLSGAQVWTADRATKKALRGVHGPRILHVATHGFFFGPARPPAASPGTRGFELEAAGGGGDGAHTAAVENPLLRSGLALAGANAKGDAKAEGMLTALEAAGLDLWGTKLVVLSACETGVGDVRAGDGVYGLRRALVMAGAETQVMSLWKVADEATKKTMVGYYRRLAAGEGRGEAMRGVQLELAADEATAHPFYWASFIVSGDPTTLEGKAAAPSPPPVAPGARGCACEVPARDRGGAGARSPLIAALVAIAGAVARRRGRRVRG